MIVLRPTSKDQIKALVPKPNHRESGQDKEATATV